jgi:protein SCO1/2
MPSVGRRTSLAMLGMAPLAGRLLAGTAKEELKPNSMSSRERTRERYFPNVILRTHQNKKVRFYDDLLKDKIVTINFMYSNCEGVCPGITANLLKVQKLLGDRMGRDIFMYSITLKPEHDTPKVLKQYAKMHAVGPGWLFLTGQPEDTELLRRKLGFTDPDPARDKDKSNHIGNVRYGNEALQLWAACPGLADARWIAESISWVDWPNKKKG